MSFDEDIALRACGEGRFECDISPNHFVVNGPNGGYLGALLAQAGELHLNDPTRQLRSLTVHYLRPPKVDPATIEVETEQHGRSVSYLRIKLIQKGKTALLATGDQDIDTVAILDDSFDRWEIKVCQAEMTAESDPTLDPLAQEFDSREEREGLRRELARLQAEEAHK